MPGFAEGAAEFAALSKNLLQVGNFDLRQELHKAVDDVAKPVTEDVRRALPAHMPNRYAGVLDSDLSLRVLKSGAGVTIRASARRSARKLRQLEGGRLTHPLYGNRHHWFTQGVRPGWFTEPIEQDAPKVRDAILAAMERVAAKATGG